MWKADVELEELKEILDIVAQMEVMEVTYCDLHFHHHRPRVV